MSGFPLNVLYGNPGCTPTPSTCAPAPACAPCAGDPCGVPGNGFGSFAPGANGYTAIATEVLQPYRAVAVTAGGAKYASNDVPTDKLNILGVIAGGANPGGSVAVFWGGPLTNPINGTGGWNWTLGTPVYLGTNGQLTQSAPLPADGFTRIIGVPLSANTIFVVPQFDHYSYSASSMVVVSGNLQAVADGNQWLSASITADVTLVVLGTPVEGQPLSIAITAVGAGRQVILPSQNFIIPTSSSASSPITVASGTETVIGLRWSATAGKWRVVALVDGY